MWFLAPGYSQLIWSQKSDVIGSCDLCYRAATSRHGFSEVRGVAILPKVDSLVPDRRGEIKTDGGTLVGVLEQV